MRTVYATSLEVRAGTDVSTSLDYVGRWIHDWYRRQRLSVDVLENLCSGGVEIEPAEGHRLSIKHYAAQAAAGERLVDIRWEYPDQYDTSLGWVIRLALFGRAQGLLLSIEVAVTGLQLLVAPAIIKLGSPRVIRDISRLRSVFMGGHLYNVTPELIAAEDVELLVSELTDQVRPYPIVVVSRRIQDDVPMVDSPALAERLAGVAKVYELTDKWSAFRLTEELTKPLSCFGGAVRIYWPRFTEQADPFAHPLWMPWQVKDADIAERTLGHLSGMVFDAAAFRHVEPAPIAHVRNAAERETREASRSERNKSSDELLEDLIAMEDKLKSAEASNAELLKENETLRENALAIAAHAGWDAQAQPVAPQPEPSPEPETPKSAVEAVTIADARTKSLRFLPSAHASAAESPYRLPDRVLQALLAIDEVASIWAETVDSGRPGGSLRQLFKKRGFDYADDISQTSKGKWGSEYVADYNGQQLDISPHITIGAKQPDSCLSIHWAWHKVEKVAVVAHVGRHKSNTKT